MAPSSRQGSSSRSKPSSRPGAPSARPGSGPGARPGAKPTSARPGNGKPGFESDYRNAESRGPRPKPVADRGGERTPKRRIDRDGDQYSERPERTSGGPSLKNPFRSSREVHKERGTTPLHRPVAGFALQAVGRIMLEGRYADKVIERAFKFEKSMGARDRRQFAELVYELVRWFRRYGHAVGWDTETRMPTVEDLWGWLAAHLVEKSIMSGNGDGRPALPNWPELSSFNPALIADKLADLERGTDATTMAIRESVPDWFYLNGAKELGTHWPRFLRELNRQAPVIIRANTLKCTRDELKERLAEEETLGTDEAYETKNGLILKERRNIFTAAAFKEGWFEVQDGASQQVADLVGAQPGERVIDACAGAGGKTLAIAANMKNKGKLIALDVHENKITELRRRVARAGIDTVEARLIESGKTIKRLEKSADRVLLDVPCSGSGVLRRNPDAKWKFMPEDLDRVRTIQAEILDEYSSMVKPGGTLVYATCSILPSENDEQVKKFLSRNSRFTLKEERHFDPGQNGYDGFYAAVMIAKA